MTKWLALSAAVLLTFIDQIIKLWAERILQPLYRITVIPDLFYLTYVRNQGAAFGMLQGKTVLLAIVVLVVLLAGLYCLLSGRIQSKYLIWTIALILGGGAGNLVDRLSRGYVVDYLDFSVFLGFPVFNFADCCVVVGTILLMIYVIWYDVRQSKQEKREA